MNNGRPLRLLTHDHAGHAFSEALSRELSARDWEVLHLYNATFVGPKGGMIRRATDPPNFEIRAINAGPFPKYSPIRRLIAELRYSRALAREIRSFSPTVLLSCNTPIVVAASTALVCSRRRIPLVSWVQDIYHLAFGAYEDVVSPTRTPGRLRLGITSLLTIGIRSLEVGALNRSAGIVTISGALADQLGSSHVRPPITIIENWAPVEDIPYHPEPTGAIHDRLGLRRQTAIVLYAGTLGAKHRGEIDALLGVARELMRQDGHLVVLSEGLGADLLREQAGTTPVTNITVAPFARHEELPSLLADANVLLAVLDPQAAAYSVPSKVLTYLCAGRPIVASMPADNAAARTIMTAGAGSVCPPGDTELFASEVIRYIDDSLLATAKGRAGRNYAEKEFRISAVADRFEAVLKLC